MLLIPVAREDPFDWFKFDERTLSALSKNDVRAAGEPFLKPITTAAEIRAAQNTTPKTT